MRTAVSHATSRAFLESFSNKSRDGAAPVGPESIRCHVLHSKFRAEWRRYRTLSSTSPSALVRLALVAQPLIARQLAGGFPGLACGAVGCAFDLVTISTVGNVTIERRGRKGRKERQHFLCGLRGLCVQAQRPVQLQDLCLPRDHDGIRLKRSRPAEPRRRAPHQAAKARSVLSRRSTWAVRSSHAASWPAKSLVRPISSSTRAVSTT